MVPGQPWQIVCETPIFKITTAKWTGDVTQVVEYLFCTHEALSAHPSLNNKKNQQRNIKGLQACLDQ
jgi:hypothetical protein